MTSIMTWWHEYTSFKELLLQSFIPNLIDSPKLNITSIIIIIIIILLIFGNVSS